MHLFATSLFRRTALLLPLLSLTGKADGKLALSDYVMVLKGRELVDFVRGHGSKSFRGPVEIRKWPRGRLQVVVRVTGRDGETMDAILESDGAVQGAG